MAAPDQDPASDLRTPLTRDVFQHLKLDSWKVPGGLSLLFRLTLLVGSARKRESRYLDHFRSYWTTERERLPAHASWSDLRDSIPPMILELRSLFGPAPLLDALTALLEKTGYGETGTAPVSRDPQSVSFWRSMDHLRRTLRKEPGARDYVESCRVSGYFSVPMLRLRHEELGLMVEDFLEEFGDWAPGDLLLETRTYREYPERLLPSLLGEESPHSRDTEGPKSLIGRRLASALAYRITIRWTLSRMLGLIRNRLLRMGALLASTGAIESKEDVFYLRLMEILSLDSPSADFRDRVMERRVEHHDRREAHRDVLEQPRSMTALHGQHPGKIPFEGSVYRLLEEEELPLVSHHLRDQVVVLRSLSPCSLPHLPGVRGLICDSGSPLSVAGLLCRSAGIPAIFGVNGALQSLRQGQVVQVRSGQVFTAQGS